MLGKRSPDKESAPLYWCPVTGKIEPGESEGDAVIREAFEEVGLKVKPLKKLAQMPTRDGSCLLHWWSVEILEGDAYLKNDEHTELRWVTLSEMEKLTPIFHEDIAFYRAITGTR